MTKVAAVVAPKIQQFPLAKFPPNILWGLSVPCCTNYKAASKGRLPACLASKSSSNDKESFRPLADFPRNIWKDIDTCFTSTASRVSVFDQSYGRQLEEVKDKVKEMLIAPTDDPAKKVNLINSLCRLGVSYHFEVEIDEQLNHIFKAHSELKDYNYDLYTVALLFRVFRQHGYKMSTEVFERFMEDDGKFKELLISDARGMLNLYEAAHLRVDGEDVLEEALAFTKAHLPSLAEKSSSLHLSKQIISALEMPFHKGMPRLETYQYISYYQEDQHKNEMLLNFAIADFNQLQLLHQQEISQLIRWWKDLNLPSKLPYIRDRIMELYFWSVAIYHEPCYSRARLIFTKVLKMMSVLDDTYDSYGTLEELKLFTDALQRWDKSAPDQLPDYMKIIYNSIFNLFDELDKEVAEEGRSYSVSCTKDTLKEMVRGYLQETQWFQEGYEPTFDEYMSNAFLTVGSLSISSTAFIGMEMAGFNAFQWLQTWPNVVKAAYKIGRLMGDITSHQFEQKRGHVDSGVEAYMKQHSISREETVEAFNVMFENAWKDMNKECMKPTAVSMQLLLRVVNIARLVEVTYKEVDGYTNPMYLKDYITKLFIDRMPIYGSKTTR